MCRFKFLTELSKGIRTPFQMFCWKKGGSRAGETVNVIWRIATCEKERCENQAFQSQATCLARITRYASRVTRQIFLAHTVNPSFINSKAAAMAIYEHITGERLPKDAGKARDYAVRMAELALLTQDFDLVQDLRAVNGRPESPLFDAFWSELKILLESHARVDDRRHGECTLTIPMCSYSLLCT